MTAAGDGRADVGVGVLDGFGWRNAEELFKKIRASGDVELFGENAEGIFTGDEMDAGDALVRFEGAG